MIPKTPTERLELIGGQRGFVTTKEIEQALPLDEMTSTEIAAVLLQLQDNGIAVNIPEFLASYYQWSKRPAWDDDAIGKEQGSPTQATPPQPTFLMSGSNAKDRGRSPRIFPATGQYVPIAAVILVILLTIGLIVFVLRP